MRLINCKVELKLKWRNYCFLSAAGNDNVNNNDSDSIIFTIKYTNLYVPVVTLSANNNQRISKLLNKGFEIDYFFLVYLNRKKDDSNLILENNTYQKELLLIIKSSSMKKVIDSGIKRKKEIRKLTTKQGQDYKTRSLLDVY